MRQAGRCSIACAIGAKIIHGVNHGCKPWTETDADSTLDWAYSIANSWRATGDIYDSFDRPDVRCPCENEEGTHCAFPGNHCSLMNIINKVTWFVHRSQPGGWNDLDMLEIGNVSAQKKYFAKR